MKKILFIDYITTGEHADYNNIQIEALCKLGCKIDICSHEKSFTLNLFRDSINNLFVLPEVNFKKNSNKVAFTLSVFRRLNYIKQIIKREKYNYVIFSSYISFFQLFFRFDSPTFLVNHYNLAILDRRRKCMIKLLAKNYIFISLCEQIQNFLKNNLELDSIVVKHGLFLKNNEKLKELSFHKQYGDYILMPASASLDVDLIENILHSERFNDFLKKNSLKLVVKGKYETQNENIIVLNRYLSHEEYHNLFYNAVSIILPYNVFFINRISATLLESITYNIPCLLSSKYLYDIYKNYFKYDAYIESSDQLVNNLDKVLNNDKIKISPYNNIDTEKSDWSFILRY